MDFSTLKPFAAPYLDKLGPYLRNALATDGADYWASGRASMGIMLELSSVGTHWTDLEQWFAQAKDCRLTVAHRSSAFATADVNEAMLAKLMAADYVCHIEIADPLVANRATYGIPGVQQPGPTRGVEDVPTAALLPTAEVLLAVIDHGCPFAHREFKIDSNKSRLVALWDQNEVSPMAPELCTTPLGFGYGRQLDSAAMTDILNQATVNGDVDEALCYQLAGQPLQTRATHGSHVLGLLAARHDTVHTDTVYPVSDSVAAKSPIAFVQLPRVFLETPSPKMMERCVYDGLRYLLTCAQRSQIKRVVAVVDYGTHLGPHDGSGWLERAIDAMIDHARVDLQIRLDIFFPAGNAFKQKTHARWEKLSQGVSAIHWVVPPSGDTPSFFELWLETPTNSVAFTLRNPSSDEVFACEMGSGAVSRTNTYAPTHGSLPTAVMTLRNLGAQTQLLVQISPTSTVPHRASAPAGRWWMELATDAEVCTAIDLYASAGGVNIGFAQRVASTRLVPVSGQASAYQITGLGNLISTGCGNKTWLIGGHQAWAPYQLAPYACSGPVRGGKRSKAYPQNPPTKTPTPGVCGAGLTAVTEQGFSRPGVRHIGTRSGSYIRLIGTSMAAPQAARAVVNHATLPIISTGVSGPVRNGTNNRPDAYEWRID